jgi:hypothetical protein
MGIEEPRRVQGYRDVKIPLTEFRQELFVGRDLVFSESEKNILVPESPDKHWQGVLFRRDAYAKHLSRSQQRAKNL